MVEQPSDPLSRTRTAPDSYASDWEAKRNHSTGFQRQWLSTNDCDPEEFSEVKRYNTQAVNSNRVESQLLYFAQGYFLQPPVIELGRPG